MNAVNTENKWLQDLPWQKVVEINVGLCQNPETPHKAGRGFEQAKELWDRTHGVPMTFQQALDICRRCHALCPFAYFNGNTFSGIVKTILAGVMSQLSTVEGQILRSTVAHYVAGVIQGKELEAVLSHFEKDFVKAMPSAQ